MIRGTYGRIQRCEMESLLHAVYLIRRCNPACPPNERTLAIHDRFRLDYLDPLREFYRGLGFGDG